MCLLKQIKKNRNRQKRDLVKIVKKVDFFLVALLPPLECAPGIDCASQNRYASAAISELDIAAIPNAELTRLIQVPYIVMAYIVAANTEAACMIMACIVVACVVTVYMVMA